MSEVLSLPELVTKAVALIAAHEDPEHRYLTARAAADELMRAVETHLRDEHGRVFNRDIDEWHERTLPIGTQFRGRGRPKKPAVIAFETALNNGTVRRQIENEGMQHAQLAVFYGLSHQTIAAAVLGWNFKYRRGRPPSSRPAMFRERA